jgi:hypothetical protein
MNPRAKELIIVFPLPTSLSRAKRWPARRDPIYRVPTPLALRGITPSLEDMGNHEIIVRVGTLAVALRA